MNRYKSTLTMLSLALVAGPVLMAQEATGALTGTVRDRQGNPIEGAEIRISGPTLQGVRSIRTDAKGMYRAPLLPPGSEYTVSARKDGYVSAPASGVVIGVSVTSRQDLLMEAATASATVEVSSDKATVDKTNTSASTTITSETFDVLPGTTRGISDAALRAPGVTPGGFTDGGRLSIRGQQGFGTRFLLNGVDIADNVFGGTNGRNSYYVDDSIAEIQVIQSPLNAKYGGFSGGLIQAISKSGSNSFSGTIRANISRTAWSAISPMGMRFDRTTGRPNPGTDLQSAEYTVFIGGPIIKDVLWFTASTILSPAAYGSGTFFNPTGTQLQTSAMAVYGWNGGLTGASFIFPTAGQQFTTVSANQFYDLKLTYALSQDHSIELAGNRAVTQQQNRNYTSTMDPRNLVPQTNLNEYQTIAYRGILGSSTTLEARYGYKNQNLSAGGDPALGDVIVSYYGASFSGLYSHNGIFNKSDGGDSRIIKTYYANLNHFINDGWFGSHSIDAGFELLRQSRSAANDQSPTGTIIYNAGYNANGTFVVDANTWDGDAILYNYSTDRGAAKNQFDSYFFNDLLTFNKNHQLMFGIRYDKSTASDTLGSPITSQSGYSPRLQYRYDLTGDQSNLFTISSARFVEKLGDGYTNRFTRAGSPITTGWKFKGTTQTTGITWVNTTLGSPYAFANITYAQLVDRNNWQINSNAGLQFYSSPLNRGTAPNTAAPYSDETSLGYRHNWNDGSFLNISYNKRKGGDFFSRKQAIGPNNEIVLNIAGTTLTSTVLFERWATNNKIIRDYESVEMEFNARLNRNWNFGGNWTMSKLQGNSTGAEGGNPPVQSEAIGFYEDVHTSAGRTYADYAPYGYLPGEQRHRALLFLTYTNKSAQGAAMNAALSFNYLGGGAYSLTRTQFFGARVAAAAAGSTISTLYPNTYTQFYGPRGIGRFNDTYSFDFKLGMEYPLVDKVRFFTEVNVFGLFNHWVLSSYSTTSIAGSNGTTALAPAVSSFRAAGITPSLIPLGTPLGFGVYGNGNFAGGRSVRLSTGFKW
ncbi:MAG: carboxypeptidase regulatory-like domain-containing protein [Holophagaceae bacterium]